MVRRFSRKKYAILFDTVVWTFVLFAFTTITYSLWPGNLPVNRIVGILIIVELVLLYSLQARKIDYLFACLIALSFVLSFGIAGSFMDGASDGVYWAVTSLMIWKFTDPKSRKELSAAFDRNVKGIRGASLALCVVLAVSLVIPGCYSESWGGSLYFVGFAPSEHTIASGSCLVLVLSFLVAKLESFRPLHLFTMLVPVAAILFSGARVFLIPAAVLVLLYIKYVKIPPLVKKLSAPFLLIVAVLVFMQTNMWDKFQLTITPGYGTENLDFLGAFTSGRSVFWLIDLNAYIQSSPLSIIFGNGFDYVYEINESSYGLRIWAHNDFIDVLLSAGLFGLLLYLGAMGGFIRQVNQGCQSRMVVILLALYMFCTAFLNGFFVSQHLVYSFLLLAAVVCDEPDERYEVVA